MAWNPNAWSYLWLTTGYQNGLVRLLNFSSMSMSHELQAQLPAHVKSMLAKRERDYTPEDFADIILCNKM